MGKKAKAALPVAEMMAYEAGELEGEEILALFQKLVKTGIVWHLQGSYGRMAKALIDGGMIEA